ncbi:YceI family protein [Roseovarius atlanticus]|uniref:YceI family protein n=1 Tax=Roseovarius atlanticus TaxID=1641875 RepID=UPI001C985E0F|nr:YceI family protein [Roseovarius atlanticus]MBY5988256.1 YceI family protein [Roseovarius atlanticus]MBY6123647.1 YceI family protein [Roseovarius atlanticus]MBY6148142.1 YceI family protein [Roseovarius atlanticus]
MRIQMLAAALAALPAAAQAEMARYELDPSHTSVYFTIDHVGYAKTLGIFPGIEGSFQYDSETQELGEVTVNIDATSVDTFHDGRNEHVRKADFLDVSNHPEITFTANGGTQTSDTEGTVEGELTILGQTQPVTLNVTLNKAEAYPFGHERFVLGLSMDASIQRSDFGMTYGVENGLVGDTVDINIETEAMRMD